MKRLMTLAMALPAAVAVAACGGASSGTSSAAPSNASSTTVSVRQLPAVGSVLVDQAGQALYTSDLEAKGKVVCDTAACNAFWKPLTPSGAKPTASSGAGKLGVITRPDGSRQVTDNGKPLYTFSEDSPGKATGNGFHDAFGGHHFTWNVVPAAGNTAGANPSGSSGNAPSNSGGGYGY